MRVKLSLCLFILLWGVLPAAPRALLSPQELGQIGEMLGTAGLRRESLTFEKDWDLAARFKMDWQLRQLQDPWRALDDLASLRESCALEDESGIPGLLNTLGGIAFNLDRDNYANIYNAASDRYTSSFSRQVRRPRDIFGWLTGHLRELKKDLSPLLESVSPREADKLLSFWLWQFIEKEDIEKYKAYYKQHKLPLQSDLDSEEIYGLLERLDLDSLQQTGLRFLALSDVLIRESARLDFPRRKPLIKKTEFGLMVIGSRSDDHYRSSELGSAPICLLLEPAGNDVYEIGLNTSHAHNFYILADFDGNDSYRNQQPAGIFRSAFGLGYSFDGAGDDLYLTDDYAFAAFAGINIHRDSSGNDIYRSGLFSQGAAMFGLALLLDEAGNDSYGAPVSAQGIGSTRGVGALLDQDGADSYLLGGKYFHEPLMPLDYITLGQGMGMGLRPDLAGGLGLLYDKAGNDRYLGGVYAQGSGYWYSVGALLDEGGNDVYNAVYYPQGSGIHLACGYLVDGGGDDVYYSRNGPGQGAGHDWGLGMLVDQGGNDAYSIHGGNGLALSNSVALFVDSSGDDRYERNEGQNYGNATLARGTGGIGLFLDAGGKDSYPDSLMANDKTWQKGTYGIGRDLNLNLVEKTAVEELAEAAPLPDSTDAIADIFAAAAEWEVGSAVQRVRKAREILIQRAEEAIPYILENKLNSRSGLEYRALEALAAKSQSFVRQLYPKLSEADSLAAKNSLSLIAGVGDSLLVYEVQELLAQDKYVTACLSALSGIKSARAVELLSQYTTHPSERYRYIVARSLMLNKHPSARPLLLTMQGDSSFLVEALLRNLPPEASP